MLSLTPNPLVKKTKCLYRTISIDRFMDHLKSAAQERPTRNIYCKPFMANQGALRVDWPHIFYRLSPSETEAPS